MRVHFVEAGDRTITRPLLELALLEHGTLPAAAVALGVPYKTLYRYARAWELVPARSDRGES